MEFSNASRAMGFSTGSLAGGDFRSALAALGGSTATAVELSALRETEFLPLIDSLSSLDLSKYQHVAVHAPSRLDVLSEQQVVHRLCNLPPRVQVVIVHADVIKQPSAWKQMGRRLCIENMDKRKATGRTVREMRHLFKPLPSATFCLDLAHARQVDPTLSETIEFLTVFRDRLGQIHLSELNARSRHESLSFAGVAALQWVRDLVPHDVPVILEFKANPHELNAHLSFVESTLRNAIPVSQRDVG